MKEREKNNTLEAVDPSTREARLTCTVCGTENDDLAVTCRSCGGFLQAKVEVLHLFSTLWGLIESPGATMGTIVRSRRKNFAMLLAALLGVAAAFAVMWARQSGTAFGSIVELTAAGWGMGLPAGILGVLVLAALLAGSGRALRGRGNVRNAYAVIAFAGSPIVYSLLILLPLEIAIFGIYLFDRNPDPMVLNRGVYLTLTALDGLAVLWSVVLLVIGVRRATGLPRGRSLLVSLCVLLGSAGLLAAAATIGAGR